MHDKKKILSYIPGGWILFIILILFSWSIIISLSGENPFTVFYYLLEGSVGSYNTLFSTLDKMVVLVLTALAVSIPGWAGIWNIGGEGQLLLGAFAAAWLGISLDTHFAFLNIIITLSFSAIAGALWAYWPALLKVYLRVDEVVTTLMGNYIVSFFTSYLVNFPFRDPSSTWPRTKYIPTDFVIPYINHSQISYTFLISIIVLVYIEVVRKRYISGYEYNIVGKSEMFARQGGINVDKIKITSMLIGGALAGLAGGLLVLGATHKFMDGFSPGYGYTGLLIALISGNMPIPILGIAFVFGALQVGSINMQLFTNVPAEISGVFQSILVFFVAAQRILLLKIRKGMHKNG